MKAIDAMIVEQRTAGNVVAATDAAMLMLRQGVGLTPPWRFCPARVATCLVEACSCWEQQQMRSSSS